MSFVYMDAHMQFHGHWLFFLFLFFLLLLLIVCFYHVTWLKSSKSSVEQINQNETHILDYCFPTLLAYKKKSLRTCNLLTNDPHVIAEVSKFQRSLILEISTIDFL